MKTLATLALLCSLAAPASAAVVWNETLRGDLSSIAGFPQYLTFSVGGNTVLGTVGNSNSPTGDRDFISFTVDNGQMLTGLILLTWSPDNYGFIAFNTGLSGFVPSFANNGNFLAGVHPQRDVVGENLMPYFVTGSVTTNSLPNPFLPPGNYTFVVQQTSPIIQTYGFEFVIDQPVPARGTSWGVIKSLYR